MANGHDEYRRQFAGHFFHSIGKFFTSFDLFFVWMRSYVSFTKQKKKTLLRTIEKWK